MQAAYVRTILQSLPATFRRLDEGYTQLENTLVATLSRGSASVDGIIANATFGSASGKWLDAWGLLFNIPRHSDETDTAYFTRISQTLIAWRGTVPAIEAFLALSEGFPNATVTENLPAVGWSLQMPPQVPQTSFDTIAVDLAAVRPAGVPFNFQVARGGLYIGTNGFLGMSRSTGAYLVQPLSAFAPNIPTSTNNAQPLIPTTYLTDPAMTGALA